MNAPHEPAAATADELAQRVARWQQAYDAAVPVAEPVCNRSGITLKPLYTALDWDGPTHPEDSGVPGEFPFTRGIYASMSRGRSWSQRQLVGLGVPTVPLYPGATFRLTYYWTARAPAMVAYPPSE